MTTSISIVPLQAPNREEMREREQMVLVLRELDRVDGLRPGDRRPVLSETGSTEKTRAAAAFIKKTGGVVSVTKTVNAHDLTKELRAFAPELGPDQVKTFAGREGEAVQPASLQQKLANFVVQLVVAIFGRHGWKRSDRKGGRQS